MVGCWTIGDAIHGPADVGQYSDHEWSQKVGERSVAVEGYQMSDEMKISETEGSRLVLALVIFDWAEAPFVDEMG